MRERYTGRLFWKLLFALWVSMLLSIVAAVAYLRSFAPAGAAPPGDITTLGLVPLAPLVSGTVAMLVVGVAVAWYLAGPLRHLRTGLAQVARGRFDTRVAHLLRNRHDELADLADDFDRMAAQLQQLNRSHQILMHDISHEMRSPLTRLQAAIGLMRQDARQTPAMLDRIEREIERMDTLVEELLTFHRLEAAPNSWTQETVDVLDLLHAVVEDADFEARAASRKVETDMQGTFVSCVRAEPLQRAFENVIRNAVKYTATATVVEVRAQVDATGQQLVVTVADRGPGVPGNARALMFEPFTRLEGSERVRGVGLGLAIARRAMDVHGGTIEVAPREGGGLLMTLRLPREVAADAIGASPPAQR